MKRTINIFLLLTYLVFTIGISTSYAFCNNELQSVKLVLNIPDESECECNCCGMCEKACCETEVKTTKIEDSQNIELNKNVKSEIVVIATLQQDSLEFNNQTIQKTTLFFKSNPPPNLEIILLTSSFLI